MVLEREAAGHIVSTVKSEEWMHASAQPVVFIW